MQKVISYSFSFFLLTTLIGTAGFGAPAVDCFKSVMIDPGALSAAKRTLSAYGVEKLAIKLCMGASNAASPIECLKSTLADPTILVGVRRTSSAYGVEVAAVELCQSKCGD